MAEAQIKVALNALARAGVEIREHDENGRDVGDVVELAPGKAHTASLKEGYSLVTAPGAAVEAPKGKTAETVRLTVSVEKDSVFSAKVDMTSGIAALDSRMVSSKEPVVLTLENESRIRITRGERNADRTEPAAKDDAKA